jgi:flavoprotein
MSEVSLLDLKKDPVVTTLANAHKTIEGFTEAFQCLSNGCVQNSLRPDIAALSLRERIVLIRLPDLFESAVEKIVMGKPEVLNIESLDLAKKDSVACWCVPLDDGDEYVVHLPVGMLMHVAVDCTEGVSMFSCINVVVCAGAAVAKGKLMLDEDDIFDAQASSMCCTSYIERSDEDWAEAWAVTAAAGTPTPWYNSMWKNDEGQMELGLASFCD